MKSKIAQQDLETRLRNIEGMDARILELMAKSEVDNFFLGTVPGSLIMNYVANVLYKLTAMTVIYIYLKSRLIKHVGSWYVMARKSRSNETSANGSPPKDDAGDVRDDQIVALACANPDIISPNIEEGVIRQKLSERGRGRLQWRKSKFWSVPKQAHDFQRSTSMPSSTEQLQLPVISMSEKELVIFMPGAHVTIEMAAGFMSEIRPPMTALRLDSGSKVITARFMTTAALDAPNIQDSCELVVRNAIKLDENATLQLGGFAILSKTAEGISTVLLEESETPIITSVTNFQGRALVVKGCYLFGTELKASTSNQCIPLRVFKEIKHKDGVLEVIFARIPEEPFDEGILIYAYKKIIIGEKSIVLRSEGKPIEMPAHPSILQTILREMRTNEAIHWIFSILTFYVIEVSSFLPTPESLFILVAWILSYCFVTATLGPWIVEILTTTPRVAARLGPCIIDAGVQVERADTEIVDERRLSTVLEEISQALVPLHSKPLKIDASAGTRGAIKTRVCDCILINLMTLIIIIVVKMMTITTTTTTL